jgi:hypothetical protein
MRWALTAQYAAFGDVPKGRVGEFMSRKAATSSPFGCYRYPEGAWPLRFCSGP